MEEGKPRFAEEFRDTAEYWNSVEKPKEEPHWRRPATDPLVEFCEKKGIRLHGHTLTWGNSKWHTPEWLLKKLPPPYRNRIPEEFAKHQNISEELFKPYTPQQLEKLFPEFTQVLHSKMINRIAQIALRYKGRLHSWDVVNESAGDFNENVLLPNVAIAKSRYGIMPGDYDFRSFKLAEAYFPPEVLLNINDFLLEQCYTDQAINLKKRGCKIDIMGAQMHLMDPQVCLDMADGKSKRESPDTVRSTMQILSQAGLPIHLSEVTITSPHNDARGQDIQAIITRNLYRLWFSTKKMMGITWWNAVDDCGAPGEPSVSGLFSRDMEPKPVFHVMNDLINNEWKTRLAVSADKKGRVSFRGFKGNYRLSWETGDGTKHSREVTVS